MDLLLELFFITMERYEKIIDGLIEWNTKWEGWYMCWRKEREKESALWRSAAESSVVEEVSNLLYHFI